MSTSRMNKKKITERMRSMTTPFLEMSVGDDDSSVIMR